MENILKTIETKAQYKKQQFENKLNNWKLNHYMDDTWDIDGKLDHNSTWAWLKLGTLKKETEGLIFAAQEQALQTNKIKAKIQGISATSKCWLCQEKDETVSHLICECPEIAQTGKVGALVIMQKMGTSGRECVRKWRSQALVGFLDPNGQTLWTSHTRHRFPNFSAP